MQQRKQAINVAMSKLNDVIILDTAGRLQIDEALMQELQNVKNGVHPHETLLVVDSMTGQEAVNVAQTFNEKVGIDGIILTKLDGTAKGGVVIGIVAENKIPVKFIGVGEQIDDMEKFNAEDFVNAII